MTDLATTLRPTSQTAAAPVTTPARKPALITEQQVQFSTAAAVALPPTKTRRWSRAMDSVARAIRVHFAGRTEPVRPHYPKRHAYLESALMAREMGRL